MNEAVRGAVSPKQLKKQHDKEMTSPDTLFSLRFSGKWEGKDQPMLLSLSVTPRGSHLIGTPFGRTHGRGGTPERSSAAVHANLYSSHPCTFALSGGPFSLGTDLS